MGRELQPALVFAVLHSWLSLAALGLALDPLTVRSFALQPGHRVCPSVDVDVRILIGLSLSGGSILDFE